jgi:nucleoside-diphosphate-sugar epimerase
MSKILIFGVSGFIGSHLAKELSSKDYEVYGTYRHWNPHSVFVRMRVHKEIATLQGDITDYNFVREAINYTQPDVVIHLAAQAHVRKAQQDPITTYRTNILGTLNILEACKSQSVQYVVYFSTDKVYGNKINATEEDSLDLSEHYAASKVCSDLIAQKYQDVLSLAIVRPCNIYGYDHNSRIVPNVIRQCLRGERPKIFKETRDHVRQYIYIKDLCQAIELLISKRVTGIYNIGTDDILTQEEVVKTICKFFKTEPEYVSTPELHKQEIARQSIDWSKIRKLGFEPKYSFEKGVEETIKHFKEYGF